MSQVVVCGGGVIGACISYYLAKKGVKPLILEGTAPACSASGKAGGFLALDWCDGSPVGPLARKSFKLHAELAETLQKEGVDYGYRRLKTHSVSLSKEGGKRGNHQLDSLPPWVDRGRVHQASVIGTEGNTAQVHPELFTKALIADVERRGGELRLARVVGVEQEGGRVTGVRAVLKRQQKEGAEEEEEEEVVPADTVVLAMGAWTTQLASTLRGVPPVSGLKVHSIVVEDSQGLTTPDALFLAYRGPEGKSLEPEVYPRPNGQVYICGVSEEGAELPPSPSRVTPRPEAIARLRGVAGEVSQALGEREMLQQQACFLPCTPDGLPSIGKVPGVEGLYMAAGHSCWGILNAPATGLAMAELIAEGRCSSLSLEAFDPGRGLRK